MHGSRLLVGVASAWDSWADARRLRAAGTWRYRFWSEVTGEARMARAAVKQQRRWRDEFYARQGRP